jgi:hypothetical protein
LLFLLLLGIVLDLVLDLPLGVDGVGFDGIGVVVDGVGFDGIGVGSVVVKFKFTVSVISMVVIV